MVDNNKPISEQNFINSVTDDEVRDFGYPSAEVYRLEHKLVVLAWQLSLGDESVHDEYYALLKEALAKGWNPNLLDGEQEVKMGWPLQKEAIDKYKTLQLSKEK